MASCPMEGHSRMRLIPPLVLGFTGLASVGALASGNGEEVMVVAGNRVCMVKAPRTAGPD